MSTSSSTPSLFRIEIRHDTAASLLGISKEELAALEQEEVI